MRPSTVFRANDRCFANELMARLTRESDESSSLVEFVSPLVARHFFVFHDFTVFWNDRYGAGYFCKDKNQGLDVARSKSNRVQFLREDQLVWNIFFIYTKGLAKKRVERSSRTKV